jgi:hypothetical protein
MEIYCKNFATTGRSRRFSRKSNFLQDLREHFNVPEISPKSTNFREMLDEKDKEKEGIRKKPRSDRRMKEHRKYEEDRFVYIVYL